MKKKDIAYLLNEDKSDKQSNNNASKKKELPAKKTAKISKPKNKEKIKIQNNANKSNENNQQKPINKILIPEAPEDKCFILCDGRIFHTYKELADALENMNDEFYYYHCNDYKNDFANWIEDVFNEKELAEKIKNAKNKTECRMEIYKHIADKINSI